MVEVFIFRCQGCGRVAPHQFWRPRAKKSGSAPEVMMQYPSPECPECDGIRIDVNHDYADGEAGDRLLREYRKKLLAGAGPAGTGGGAGAGAGGGAAAGAGSAGAVGEGAPDAEGPGGRDGGA